MIIDSIQNGIVIDHITAGKSMELYQILGLDQLDCTVAILKNVTSGKLGCKDIIKIDREMDLDWDLIGYVDPSITSEEKPNQREKINIKYAEARRFIPASVPYEKTGDYIMKALEYYHRYQERQKSRNDAR